MIQKIFPFIPVHALNLKILQGSLYVRDVDPLSPLTYLVHHGIPFGIPNS